VAVVAAPLARAVGAAVPAPAAVQQTAVRS
jgi:hypothetical protein